MLRGWSCCAGRWRGRSPIPIPNSARIFGVFRQRGALRRNAELRHARLSSVVFEQENRCNRLCCGIETALGTSGAEAGEKRSAITLCLSQPRGSRCALFPPPPLLAAAVTIAVPALAQDWGCAKTSDTILAPGAKVPDGQERRPQTQSAAQGQGSVHRLHGEGARRRQSPARAQMGPDAELSAQRDHQGRERAARVPGHRARGILPRPRRRAKPTRRASSPSAAASPSPAPAWWPR